MSKMSDFLGEQQKKQSEFMKAHPDMFDPNFYEKAQYEDPIVEEQDQLYESLLRDTPICEAGVDNHDATAEWVYTDEDNHRYYTYRCDEHAPENPEYEMRDL